MIRDLPKRQRLTALRGDLWQAEDMSDVFLRGKANVVFGRPGVAIARDEVVDGKRLTRIQADRGVIDAKRPGLSVVRIKVDNDEYGVAGYRVDFRVRDELLVVDVVEANVAQLLQRRILLPNMIK